MLNSVSIPAYASSTQQDDFKEKGQLGMFGLACEARLCQIVRPSNKNPVFPKHDGKLTSRIA